MKKSNARPMPKQSPLQGMPPIPIIRVPLGPVGKPPVSKPPAAKPPTRKPATPATPKTPLPNMPTPKWPMPKASTGNPALPLIPPIMAKPPKKGRGK